MQLWSNSHLDIVYDCGELVHFQLCGFIDAFQFLDGAGGALDVLEAFFQIFAEILHPDGEIRIEFIDFFLKISNNMLSLIIHKFCFVKLKIC